MLLEGWWWWWTKLDLRHLMRHAQIMHLHLRKVIVPGSHWFAAVVATLYTHVQHTRRQVLVHPGIVTSYSQTQSFKWTQTA